MAELSTDEELLTRAAGGDPGALRTIWERSAARLVREVIGPLLPDRAACEDVLKETFVVALERLPALAGGEPFPWLSTIARNKALDRLRRLKTEGRFREAIARELDCAAAEQPDPEELLVAAQERARSRERVLHVLRGMNERYARAMRLRILEERPREVCAELLEVKLGTFDVLLFRACKQFRALYVESYGAAGGGVP